MADLPVKRRKVPPKTDNEKAVTQASEQTKAKARTRKAAPKEVDATTAMTATAERTIRRATSGPKQPKASMVPKDRLAADSSVSAPTAAKKVASSATGVHESASPGLTRPSKPLAESVGLAAGPVRKTQASLQRAGGQVVPPNAVLPAPAFVPRQSSSESAWNNGPRGAGSQSAFPPHVTYKGASRRIVAIMTGLPIAIVTSYFLYQRVIEGKEAPKLPSLTKEDASRRTTEND